MDNIFVKGGVAKIGDFGFSTKENVSKELLGTPYYMSPELLKALVD